MSAVPVAFGLYRVRGRKLGADRTEKVNRGSKHIDPWLKVCERCPLDDCVIPEGGHFMNQQYPACPVWQAKRMGLEARVVLENAVRFKLREPVEWLEW